MVSVSGMGGLSATKGFETLFQQLGLEFQEVASIPDVSECPHVLHCINANLEYAKKYAGIDIPISQYINISNSNDSKIFEFKFLAEMLYFFMKKSSPFSLFNTYLMSSHNPILFTLK